MPSSLTDPPHVYPCLLLLPHSSPFFLRRYKDLKDYLDSTGADVPRDLARHAASKAKPGTLEYEMQDSKAGRLTREGFANL